MSYALFQSVLNMPLVRPTFALSKILAFLIAAMVHMITVLFAAVGVFMLIRGWPNIIAIIGGLLLLALAWATRPQLARMPQGIAPEDQFPMLYKMFDRIAEQLGAPRVHGIVIGPDFNAGFTQIGLRRKSIVFIGLPLFAILNGQEKVAIAAHELAHGVNGDPLRGVFIRSAVDTLIVWSYVLYPDGIWQPGDGTLMGFVVSMFMIPVNIALIGISKLVLLIAEGLVYLNYRASQRAEYLADYLATTVSGTEAMLSALEKLYFQQSIDLVVQQSVLQGADKDMFKNIRAHIQQIPSREVERLRRVHLLEDARLDVTHPPTAYRVAFLNARRVPEPVVTLSTVEMEQIEHELSSMEATVRRQLSDAYKQSLYR